MANDADLIVGKGLRVISAGDNSEKMSGDLWGQISVAKSFPRAAEVFRRKVEQDVCCNAQQAQDCTYLVKRGQDDISGPSVRFAEALLRAWGNVRVSTEIADDTGTHIVARARFWDLESNMAFSEDVFRRVTTKTGARYSDDMIGTTKNAAQAIAFRNVVLAGIPKSEWQPIYEKTLEVQKGQKPDAEFEKRKGKLLKWFRKIGVTDSELAEFLTVMPDDAQLEDVIRLEQIGKSIHDGFTTIEEAFGRAEQSQQTTRPNGNNGAGNQASESQKWDVDLLSRKFSRTEQAAQSSAIVLAIEAAALGDISAAQLKQLATDHCGHEGDVAGTLLVQLLTAGSAESCSTIGNEIHSAKSQKKIDENVHKSLSGLIARRMRDLKGKK
jgi:hypothetical protein